MSRDPHEVPCTLVNQPDQVADLQTALRGAVAVAIDTETPISGPKARQMRVMSVATRAPDGTERAFVVDVRDLDAQLLGSALTGVTACAWNANFDARVVDAAVWQSETVTTDLTWWDAQLGDALLHQGRSGVNWYHGLAWATQHYLGFEAEGKGTIQTSYTADDDLSVEQISYAAADAVETLWVADAIQAELTVAGLQQISDIEMAARPFLDQMERCGLPFDWPGWEAELQRMESQHRDTIGRLAELTGGGQGSLFDEVVEPSWNPASDRQVRYALNRWAEQNVLAWMERRRGKRRLLDETDSVTATVLREIGGPLCESLLEFRTLTKVLTTYGQSIHEHLHPDGRLRPQYLQVVGTNTGRLASRNPNAQNFTPRMKPFVRPSNPDRVFVYADLSQAELRFLAQVAEDLPLRAAFARGDDVHISTAASMFGFDAAELAQTDPDRLKHLRQIAKALNFGIAYGSGASALSRSLTAEGSPTSVDEAAHLLDQYRQTYPGTAAWAQERIAEISRTSKRTSEIDWPVTMRLARGFTDVRDIRRSFRKTQNRWPNAAEIVELHPDRETGDRHTLLENVQWLLQYSAPVALHASGQAFTFSSRTLSGRRQQFNLHLDRLFLFAAMEAIENQSPELVAVRTQFEAEHGVVLQRNGVPLPHAELSRQFEDRSLRRRYLEAVAQHRGDALAHGYLHRAARERVSAMVNAWRNAPIQGGVADIMLVAYADLHHRLRQYPTAVPVQTVHDSVVVECDRTDGPEVVQVVREALEKASLRFCPDVAPKADIDIRASLADADIVQR